MTYSEQLAERIRDVLASRKKVSERKMFGGLAFMVNGHLCCGVVREELMVRVGPVHYERALQRKHVREMDFTGRPLRGMVYVGIGGIRRKQDLKKWLDEAVTFTKTLPKE